MSTHGNYTSSGDSLVEAAASAKDLSDVKKTIRKFCDDHGMEHFIYGSLKPVSFVRPEIVIVNGYPDEWRDHYEKNEYMAVDPTVQHCRLNAFALDWAQIDRKSLDKKSTSARCIGDARDFGLIEGVSVPLHTVGSEWGMISVAAGKYDKQTNAEMVSKNLNLLAPHLHEAVNRIESDKESPLLLEGNLHLTAREKEVLLWSSEGKTTSEVAMILHISERTVTFHTQNILNKLNVRNRTHAVARAISLGLINPLL